MLVTDGNQSFKVIRVVNLAGFVSMNLSKKHKIKYFFDAEIEKLI